MKQAARIQTTEDPGQPEIEVDGIIYSAKHSANYVLWDRLTMPVFQTRCLRDGWSRRLAELNRLDQAPRHDTIISVRSLGKFDQESLGLGTRQLRVEREFHVSIHALELAAERLKGRLRGEAKVRLEDRLTRHLAEARNLADIIDDMISGRSMHKQPYTIRQQIMYNKIFDIDEISQKLVKLRDCLTARGLAEPLRAALVEQLAGFGCLRSKLARWRDSPSQKLAAKFAAETAAVEALFEGMTALHLLAKNECKKEGIKFQTRWGAPA